MLNPPMDLGKLGFGFFAAVEAEHGPGSDDRGSTSVRSLHQM
jgi:hypothetical protein